MKRARRRAGRSPEEACQPQPPPTMTHDAILDAVHRRFERPQFSATRGRVLRPRSRFLRPRAQLLRPADGSYRLRMSATALCPVATACASPLRLRLPQALSPGPLVAAGLASGVSSCWGAAVSLSVVRVPLRLGAEAGAPKRNEAAAPDDAAASGCPGLDLNQHAIARTTPSRWRVYGEVAFLFN